jgi:3-oxoacyl-[acyl-carrier protein] reductase
MDLGLAGKTALVTGGSRGIGFAAAVSLAAEGCHLHLAARNAADLEKAKAKIQSAHKVQVTCHVRDLSKHDECVALGKACGDIDILVNNAGAIPGGSLRNLDNDAWRKGWELKLFGYISLTREVYKRMCERKLGTIINVIGTAGERPNAGYIAGSTANAGLMHFTRALGAEAPDNGVRVVGVNPGKTATERQVNLAKDAAREKLGDENRFPEIMQAADANLPYGRSARPDELGDVIAFLASSRASYVNGTIVTVDGGNSLRSR